VLFSRRLLLPDSLSDHMSVRALPTPWRSHRRRALRGYSTPR